MEQQVYNLKLLKLKWWFASFPLLWFLGVASSFLFRPMSFTPTQTVVFFFEIIGPYWPITFGLAFILLLITTWKEKNIEHAYYLGVGINASLFVATMYGVIVGGGWVGASAAFVMAGICLVFGHLFRWGREEK